jgi:hypothetical protein
MRRAVRIAAATTAILFGLACLVMAVRIFARTGPPAGMKAVVYLWVLPLAVPLPVSFGMNLLRQVVAWRVFAAGWLAAWGTLYLTGLLWVLPDYRFELLPFLAVASPGVACLIGGLLLLWGSGGANPSEK